MAGLIGLIILKAVYDECACGFSAFGLNDKAVKRILLPTTIGFDRVLVLALCR
jgi:hypothetical protein